MPTDPRPACLITGTVSPYRREPFRLLCEAEGVEVLAFEDAGPPLPGLRTREVSQAGAVAAVARGRYRAVICGIGGRLALPGSYLAARSRRVPFVLWATIWEHPRTLPHRLSFRPTRHLYRHADAVVTYGSHVSRYVAGHRGSEDGVVIAPQAVDTAHFGAPQDPAAVDAWRERTGSAPGTTLVLFAGRLESEKGIETLLNAWRVTSADGSAVLAVAGEGPLERKISAEKGVRMLGYVHQSDLPSLYAAADVLVLPSVRTATFREPWGLVVNEAMLQHTPVIATDAVGAAAGGLVRDGVTGTVVPAGRADALSDAIARLMGDPESRERMGAAAREAALELDPAAWCAGMRTGLAIAGGAR